MTKSLHFDTETTLAPICFQLTHPNARKTWKSPWITMFDGLHFNGAIIKCSSTSHDQNPLLDGEVIPNLQLQAFEDSIRGKTGSDRTLGGWRNQIGSKMTAWEKDAGAEFRWVEFHMLIFVMMCLMVSIHFFHTDILFFDDHIYMFLPWWFVHPLLRV